jgi:hypothetical protein
VFSVSRKILVPVLLILVLSTNGCYTVFHKGAFDSKPSEEIDVEATGEFSGDLAFHGCTHERWSHYIFCPWWKQSIFLRGIGPEDEGGDTKTETEPDMTFVAPGAPALEQRFSFPSTPLGIPSSKTNDIRHKPSGGEETSAPKADESATAKKETRKPSRRSGPGGRR